MDILEDGWVVVVVILQAQVWEVMLVELLSHLWQAKVEGGFH